MKKIKLIVLLSIVSILQLSAQPKKVLKTGTFELKGSIAGLESPGMMLRYESGGKMIIDTVVVFNGSFLFTGHLDGPTPTQMMSSDFKFSHSQYLENAKMTIIKKDSIAEVVFSGSVTEDENIAFNKYRASLGDKIYILRGEIEKLSKTDSAAASNKAKTELYPLYDSMVSRTLSFFKLHPKSLVSLVELGNISGSVKTKELNQAYLGLDERLRESSLGKDMAILIDKRMRTEIGVQAMNFTQNDTVGKAVSLETFKGKYVLVDFWASWCGPCRRENPNIVKEYNKYKNKGFAILGVSLDQDTAKWKSAIIKDQLDWVQVSDLKGWQNAVATKYGIQAVPANFLLDPKGIIIAKDIRGDELEKKLAEIFSN